MRAYEPDKHLEELNGGLQIIPETERLIDQICADGYSSIIYLGIGGTLLAEGQVLKLAKQCGCRLPIYLENAADLVWEAPAYLDEKSLVITCSASGDTKEIITAVDFAHEKGARVLAYVATPGTPLAQKADYVILSPFGETQFLYTVTFRLMANAHQFDAYPALFEAIRQLSENLIRISQTCEDSMAAIAEAICDEPLTYIVGSGSLEDWATCYGMCIMEEMLWMRTRPISAANFFHGTLEVIERDIPLLLFFGEDKTRPEMERVRKFAETISAKVYVIDTADYQLDGIDPALRPLLSPFITSVVCRRLSAHLEHLRRHPMAIRRYYRRLTY